MWSWFAGTFGPVLRELFADLIGTVVSWFSAVWTLLLSVVVVIWSVVAFILWGIVKIKVLILSMPLAALSPIKPAASMIHFYVFINRFAPLDEAFAGVGICFSVWLTVTLIRWIKGFIPFISN